MHAPASRLPSFLGLLATLAGAALTAPAAAQELKFTYQGRLNMEGAPANGLYDFQFALHGDPLADDSPIGFPICMPAVEVVDGFFTVELEFDEASYFPGGTYLQINVGEASPEPCGFDAGMVGLSPRQLVNRAPYSNDSARFGGQDPAFYLNASNLTGTVPSSQFAGTYSEVLNLSNPANLFMGNGAGINNLNATRVTGGTLADARLSTNVALLGSAQTFSGAKTFSAAPTFSAATPFTVTGTGLVANLNADKLDGLDSSVFVRTDGGSVINGSTGASVLTLSGPSTFYTTLEVGSLSSTAAVRITRQPGMQGPGLVIYDQASQGAGISINQTVAASTATGLAISQSSPGMTGINVVNGASSGAAVGVFSYIASTSGTGGDFTGNVGLRARGNGNDGIVARSDGATHSGVYSVNDISSGVGYGVYGQCLSASGYGLFANGRTGASGTKSFRIDHPADPTGKYLLHYSAESPEVLNLYRGTVTLDGAGEATVLLPDYFAAVNTNPSYQLTPVGAAMPGLFVSGEIDQAALDAGAKAQPGAPIPACSFTIAGGVAGAKVCWTVQAQRFDRFVQVNGAPVEVAKEGREAGVYQMPELYGKPANPAR
jgi:hypothetical protein